MARHYEAVVDVLRDYLEAGQDIPAHERTTAELLWSLPPHLAFEGLRERFQRLLDEADLVEVCPARAGFAKSAGLSARV